MDICLLCRDFNKLADWEYRLFNEILNHHSIKIKKIYQKKKTYKNLNLNDFLFKIFVRIEHIHTKLPSVNNKIRFDVIRKLKKIPLERIDVKSTKYCDYFDKKLSIKIKKEKYDLILRHDFNIIKGEILNSSKYGIWSFHHGDSSRYRGGPSGFWEIINNEPVTGVTLIKLNKFLDKGDIIDKGFYSTKKNFLINNYFIMDKSFKLLIKNINILANNKKISFSKFNSLNDKIYKSPSLIFLFKYYKIYLFQFLKKLKKYFFKKFLNKPNNIWTIFNSDISKININSKKEFKLKKNEFWADPFFFNYLKKDYIFFERYYLNKKKGVISSGQLIDNKIINLKDIVVRKHHLSYPQIFNYKNKIFMTFESWQAKKCELLQLVNFPNKWKNYNNFLNGINSADPTFYTDKNNNLWLFINISKDLYNDHDSELYIYLVKNNFKKFIPHLKNPVITDSRYARNAGSIFNYKGKIIRPSQINIHDSYGYGLNFQEIKKLSLDEYLEVNYKKFFYDKKSKYNGIHHVTKSKTTFYFDRRYKYQ